MAAPSEKLAESLDVLKALQKEGAVAIRSADLTRVHRERLLKGGFLQEVMKGWYIPVRPDEPVGESTAWYACFWDFCAAYLRARFGNAWCLSPDPTTITLAGLLQGGQGDFPVKSGFILPILERRAAMTASRRRVLCR